MQQQYPKPIRQTLLCLILSLVIGLGFSTPTSLAQEPSEGKPLPSQANKAGLPTADFIQQAKLTAAERIPWSYFGDSVAINGNTTVVGASGEDRYTGAAYIFEKPGTGSWAEANRVAKLIASDGESPESFGIAVAISGDTVFIGAYGDDENKGAVYVFTKPASGWADTTEAAKLTAVNGQTNDFFGLAISIANNGESLVIGAREADNDTGAAYIFE